MWRCLIVANQTLASAELLHEVLARKNDETEFRVLVPASHIEGVVSTEGAAIARARVALEQALAGFREEGIDATGEVGDGDPVLAVGDVLNRYDIDEIVVSTLPPGVSRWLKRDLPNRLRRRYDIPVTHVAMSPAPTG